MIAIVDNDVVHKLARYGLLRDLRAQFDDQIGILGTLKYVVGKKLRKAGRDEPQREFDDFLMTVLEVEPTAEEVTLAADFELAGLRDALRLDVGESILCAIAIQRLIPLIVTGDKAAIVSIEKLMDSDARLLALEGKLKCLEQLFLDFIQDPTRYERVHGSILSDKEADKTLSICFAGNTLANATEGLQSYIADLRSRANRALFSA